MSALTYRTVDDVDWDNWKPMECTSLMFVIRDRQILLIHKKRGLGKGKINGPGGKIESGETPRACAIRETQEELCITPSGVEDAGLLYFQFNGGFSIHAHVFTATDFTGTPTETDEAIPLWHSIDEIPYAQMWQDSHTWFPHMLEGRCFSGRYIFDGECMISAEIDMV